MAIIYGLKASDGEPKGVAVNDDGELVVNLEAATVNIGDVDVLSSALPTGAATATNQAAISAKLPASLGKKAASASFSVVQSDPVRTVAGHSATATGSAQALSAISAIYQQIYFFPDAGNSGTFYWGGSDVQAGHGIPIGTSNPSVNGPIDAANIYVIGTLGDILYWNGIFEA